MREIVLASHGLFAEGAFDSVNMIVGEQKHVRTYQLRPGENAADFAAELQKEIIQQPDTEYLILTDLYGASVCNAMLPLSSYPNVVVFTGMNLCMALEVIMSDAEPFTEEKIEELIETAQAGIKCVRVENTAQEDF